MTQRAGLKFNSRELELLEVLHLAKNEFGIFASKQALAVKIRVFFYALLPDLILYLRYSTS